MVGVGAGTALQPSPAPSPPASEEGGGGGGEEEEEGPTDLKGRLIDAVVGGPPESPTDWALHIFSIIPKVAPFRVRVNLGLGPI